MDIDLRTDLIPLETVVSVDRNRRNTPPGKWLSTYLYMHVLGDLNTQKPFLKHIHTSFFLFLYFFSPVSRPT